MKIRKWERCYFELDDLLFSKFDFIKQTIGKSFRANLGKKSGTNAMMIDIRKLPESQIMD